MKRFKWFMFDYENDFNGERKSLPITDEPKNEDEIVMKLIELGYLNAEDIAFVDVRRGKDSYKVLNKSNALIFLVEKS